MNLSTIFKLPFMVICDDSIVNHYESIDWTYMGDVYYTLPEWCDKFEKYEIDSYNVKIKQRVVIDFSFYGDKSYDATLNFELLSSKNFLYVFSMTLSVERCQVTNTRDWQFIYNSVSKEIKWFLLEGEVDIMLPPPHSSMMRDFCVKNNFLYIDGTIFILPTDSNSLVPDYQIIIELNEITRFLMAR